MSGKLIAKRLQGIGTQRQGLSQRVRVGQCPAPGARAVVVAVAVAAGLALADDGSDGPEDDED